MRKPTIEESARAKAADEARIKAVQADSAEGRVIEVDVVKRAIAEIATRFSLLIRKRAIALTPQIARTARAGDTTKIRGLLEEDSRETIAELRGLDLDDLVAKVAGETRLQRSRRRKDEVKK